MGRLFILLISLFVMIPSIVSAHTELTSSNPAEGKVVKNDLKEIVLTYEGKIESLSTMKLFKDGQEIPLESVSPKNNKLTGKISSPLENGTYIIKWNVAGEDGHPLLGEIPFTVHKEVRVDQNMETKTPVTTNKEKTQKVKKQPTNPSSSMKTIITVIIVLILVIGFVLLFRRKR